MSRRSPVIAFLALLFCATCTADARTPSLELTATGTNLVVTETASVSLTLRLPPLKAPNADIPPFLNQRPPHMTAAFLEQDWKGVALQPVDPKNLLALPPGRNRSAPSFTLNNYVTDGIFSAMHDPFGMFEDDDLFGRMGPKKQLFPFVTEREKDGSWRFSVKVSPWRAAEPGTVKLDSVTVEVPFIAGVRTGRDRFGRPRNEAVLSNIVLRTRPLEIVVSEPPDAGRPASYCGAIASNLTVVAKLDTNICTAGDPLMLTLDVAGAANPSAVHPPDFAAVTKDSVFRIDAASAKTETLADSRRFTWRVRPVKAGTVEFPSLPVAYYDLDRRAYVEVKTESIPIQVKAGAQAALGALDETGDETDVFPLPDGVDLDPRGAAAEPLLPHLGLALALFFMSPILFLVIRLAPLVRRRVAARSEMLRKANAFKKCQRVLRGKDDAKKLESIRTFFTVRYGVNGASVTASDAARLMAADYTQDEVDTIVQALSALDAKNYASSSRAQTSAVVALLVLLLGCFAQAEASAPSRIDFTYQRAGSLAMRATDEAGFRKAASAYLECVDAGAANATIYANLGGCLLMAGDGKGARAAFACAERRSGETASTARGVRAAWARIRNDARAEAPLARIFLKPHVKWTLDMRLLIAVGAWALLWLMALLPAGSLRRFLLTVCLIAFCASALSVTVSLASEHLAKEALHAQK